MKRSKLFIFLLVLTLSITSVVFADTLQYGSKGQAVGKLQAQLKSLGYFKANVTNYYGSATKAAVKKFQAGKGIAADGIAGPQTSKLLFGNGTSSRSSASNTNSAAARESLKKSQSVLKQMGLYKGKIDGLNGKLTIAAVKEFQKKYGLKTTGAIDKETETKILSHYAAKTASSRGGSTATDSPASRKEAVNAEKGEALLLKADTGATLDTSEAAETVETVEAAEADSTAASEGEKESREPEADEDKEPAKKEEKGKIEVLDWWTGANKVFARGSNAKVIDVRTGKSFNIKRTYGGNHADCETLTKEDTKVMKEIWGGTFNWSRRPVIVEINGRRLAASMSGMPHAGLDNKPINVTVSSRSGGFGRGTNLDTVKKNDMDGHFDIHFKNSRTHGTNRVDAAHQKAIKEAAAAKL
ncbi:MAG TPA: peptidoglycan-binding protein [Clostridia bacterium]|nr:peptidoglycan-binding protein [Clostridia bacterium]